MFINPLKGRFESRWRSAVIGAALAVLLGLFFRATLLGEGLVNLSYDLAFYFRSDVKMNDAVILYMDLPTHQYLKLERFGQRWNREVHAQLLRALAKYHARTVVFDILFLGASTNNPAGDEQLVQAAQEHGNVVAASMVSYDITDGQTIGMQLLTPFPKLAEVVQTGVVEEADANRFIRQDYFRGDFNEPSLASRAAKLSTTNRLPDPFQERWLNFYGPPGSLPHHSLYEVIETNSTLDPLQLSNKVVFVGALYSVGFTGGTGTDDYNTPYTRWTHRKAAGVENIATSFLNLVHNQWLSRMSWIAEVALLLFTGALFGGGLSLSGLRMALGLGVLGAAAVAAVAIISVWQTHVWFCWLIVSAVQIPAALGWSVATHVKTLMGQKRSLEQAMALMSKGEPRPEPDSRTEPSSPRPAPEVVWGRMVNARFPASPPVPVDRSPPSIPDRELLNCFGEGAYGEVWLARDMIGSFHAVKVVYRNRFQDARPLEREFNGIKRFTPISRSHPGFVNVLQVGRNEDAGYIYYVMELGDDLATGQKIEPRTYRPKTLATELQRRTRLPLPECLEVAIHLADTLEYLHQQQLIHRDIKPSNIIFVNGLAKFADIGLVTDIATEGSDVSYLGTPGRIPPEGPGTPASDVYALGKMLYEMGFGLGLVRFPELPTDLIQSAEGAELFEFNRIVMKACEPDVRKRYQTAAELCRHLSDLQKSIGARPNLVK